MIAATGFMLCALIAMLAAGDTPIGRLFHEECVERPVAALARFRTHHILYAIILIPVMLSGGEFVALLGPEFFAAYALELAIYIDAVIVTALASACTQVRAAAQKISPPVTRVLGRARRKRARLAPQQERRPANDDERDGSVAIAA
ncbi:hypothetical protein [Aurantiacibacter aquimixticola]|uniref:Uncharacterized protein n=1 Tax=Aurantiacibacter aquimixticola TaxID=1958945 RepID=A0A419RWB9_9SPHN|nr:hypothetical protein [Aurantiacibacter aquimixticola]RJY10078.1 hypothetical protein D6201_12590 [Aurantiacibacter aquimixticola]